MVGDSRQRWLVGLLAVLAALQAAEAPLQRRFAAKPDASIVEFTRPVGEPDPNWHRDVGQPSRKGIRDVLELLLDPRNPLALGERDRQAAALHARTLSLLADEMLWYQFLLLDEASDEDVRGHRAATADPAAAEDMRPWSLLESELNRLYPGGLPEVPANRPPSGWVPESEPAQVRRWRDSLDTDQAADPFSARGAAHLAAVRLARQGSPDAATERVIAAMVPLRSLSDRGDGEWQALFRLFIRVGDPRPLQTALLEDQPDLVELAAFLRSRSGGG